jgi:UDP-3-O-[3-hydroxymyristoyl] N-acetylglucosamine deacetylase
MARTFGFLHEVSALRKAGLAKGGSLENTVVLNSTRVINADGLRWKDEFVRHKILDMIGDLSLLGVSLQGHVHVERGGHALHQRLVRAIIRRPDAWELIGSNAQLPNQFEAALLSAAG